MSTKRGTLQSQKDKSVDYVNSWKSEGLYSFTLSLQYNHFLHIIKFFGCKIGIKFDSDPLLVEQNSYANKIVNAYIVYELNT